MSREDVIHWFNKLHRKYFTYYCMHALLWITTMGAALYALLSGIFVLESQFALWWGLMLLAFTLFIWQHPPILFFRRHKMIDYLHRVVPETEYALRHLLYAPDTPFYNLLLGRVGSRLMPIQTLPYPFCWKYSLRFWFIDALVLAVIGSTFGYVDLPQAARDETTWHGQLSEDTLVKDSTRVQFTVFPPAYTGMRVSLVEQAQVRVPEGSRLHWKVYNSSGMCVPLIIDHMGDTIRLVANNAMHFSLSLRAEQSALYRLYVGDALYAAWQVDVVPDHAPAVRWLNVNEKDIFISYDQATDAHFSWEWEATDDYGIEQLEAKMTIARGLGEEVSFIEKNLPVEYLVVQRHSCSGRLHLQPFARGATWGDEVFVSLYAKDNRQPVPNLVQFPVIRLLLEDTTYQAEFVEDFGIGIRTMPDYFRSQRQIIIDTEQLIAKQKQLPGSQFLQRSQDIAFDQKALRLRYGQFLGMEDYNLSSVQPSNESGNKGHAEHEHGEYCQHEEEPAHAHEHEHVHDSFLHTHDDGHEHHADVPEAYMHVHDWTEINTFLDPDTRETLRRALSAMWQSEKYLRLAEPSKALPHQYEALRWLKLVQQSSRIYLRKSDTQLPALSEADRLIRQHEVPNNQANKILQPNSHLLRYHTRLEKHWQRLWLYWATNTYPDAQLLTELQYIGKGLQRPDSELLSLGRQVAELSANRTSPRSSLQILLGLIYKWLKDYPQPVRRSDRLL